MKTSRLIVGLTIVGLTLSTSGIALAVPSGIPTGANTTNTGGIFATYFENLATNCTGQVITGFRTSPAEQYLTPNCSTLGDLIDNTFITNLFSNSFYDNKLTNWFTTYITTHPITSQWGDVAGGIAYTGANVGIGTDTPGTKLDVVGDIQSSGNNIIRNTSPTIFLKDTDHRSAMIHNNSNLLYFLRGSGNDSTTWAAYNGMWPLVLNLENNNATFGGTISVGATAGDYLPTGSNWNYTLQLNGKDNTSIGFHDSMASVSSIRYNNAGFVIGGDDGWGVKNVLIPGNVGIGTATPGAKLDVAGKTNIYTTNPAGASTARQLLVGEQSNNPAYKLALGYFPEGSWKGLIQATDNNAGAILAINPLGGNVGIGMTAPGEKLEVNGNLKFTGWTHLYNGSSNFHIDASPTGSLYLDYFSGGGVHFGNGAGGESGIWNSAGRVGIGTISPTQSLDVNGYIRVRSTNSEGGTIQLDGNNGTTMWLENLNGKFRLVNSPWTLDIFNIDQSGNVTAKGAINASGNVTANGFVYNSDRNLKKNITPLSGSLEKILALNGYSFDWKSTGTKDIGVIAQEVETVFPELVHTNSEGIKSVEYGNLIAPLIEAMKIQQKEIESLKAEVASLKISK